MTLEIEKYLGRVRDKRHHHYILQVLLRPFRESLFPRSPVQIQGLDENSHPAWM